MIEVKNLCVSFDEEVVHNVSFSIADGEILGIVGESGSGKTQTALALSGLSRRAALSGSVTLEGRELLGLPRDELRKIQGKDISIIFQEPMTSLNPTQRIGRQVEESLKLHTNLSKEERRQRALEALRDVELPDPEGCYRKYPHQLSGGQRQRVMIASAIVCRPKLLVADEPTTALDVTIQEQILKLLVKLNRELGMSILFISHDLRVISKLCSRVIVMQKGLVVEDGPVRQVFLSPREEYTRRLISSIPMRPQKGGGNG